MWWQLIAGVIAEIVRLYLERRIPAALTGAPKAAALEDTQADRLAARLEAAMADAPKGADPTTHDGGVIQHVQELIAALRARDWPKVIALITDLLSHV